MIYNPLKLPFYVKIIFNIKNFGFEIENNPEQANIIIINTCAFLESAREESIENILEIINKESLITVKNI